MRINNFSYICFVTGYGPMDFNIKYGVRWHTYFAFIKPVEKRTNLNVYRYARAVKVCKEIIQDLKSETLLVNYTIKLVAFLTDPYKPFG